MPRRARMYLPEMPYHIVQRGNNRGTCFTAPDDYRFYLNLWEILAPRYGVSVHAWCLMTNHIHFLATPKENTSISTAMKVIGSRYALYYNNKYNRTGTLWEGRHHSSLVQSDRYFLTCMRYIELNPVRARLVMHPEDYNWSSYITNALGHCSWVKPHPVYHQLGSTSADRQTAYRNLFLNQLGDDELQLIRNAAHYCHPICDNQYKERLQKQYGIDIGQMKRGRPASKEKGDGGIKE